MNTKFWPGNQLRPSRRREWNIMIDLGQLGFEDVS
jgi:hypothetical protein